ncbi:hypothetical protein, conserved [Angomonas deanei]|uniref:CHASE domain-containing protein n=1 Tax=Angomonas deanei TaxID=59799 RepID=A0A7G2CM62_9TRYP|nr:hypothetical protein, conserved [Angomonas deanei]
MNADQKALELKSDTTKNRKRRRYVSFIVLAFVCFFILAASFAIIFVVLGFLEAAHLEDVLSNEMRTATYFSALFRESIITGVTVSGIFDGYVAGAGVPIPPLNGTTAQRVFNQSLPHFDEVGKNCVESSRFVSSVFLSPGGVTLYSYPPDPVNLYKDLFVAEENDWTAVVTPTPWDTLRSRRTDLVGPLLSPSVNYTDAWVTLIRRPIFFAESADQFNNTNFWGFSSVVLNVSDIIKVTFEEANTVDSSLDVLLYVITTSGDMIGMYSSLPILDDRDALHNFLTDAQTETVVQLPINSFKLAIKAKRKRHYTTGENIAAIVAGVLFFWLLVFAVGSILLLVTCKVYDGRPHAPKSVPFALLTIGHTRGEVHWCRAPDVMPRVSSRLQGVLSKHMVKHHSYQIAPRQAYTNSYVMRTVDAAVEMAFAVLEDLQRHPIDEELKTALGTEDGAVLLSCMVHWCTEATVLVGSGGKSYLYEGADLDLGSRLWLHASPGVVTLSEEAKEHGPRCAYRYTLTPRSVNMKRNAHTVYEVRKGACNERQPVRRSVGAVDVPKKPAPPVGDSLEASNSGTQTDSLHASLNSKGKLPGGARISFRGNMAGSLLLDPYSPLSGGRRGRALSLSSSASSPSKLTDYVCSDGDVFSRKILDPDIPPWLDMELNKAFDHQAAICETEYEEIRVIMYYFFASFKLLFQPLAAPERANIYHRLISAFGVPQQNILEHLAARCTLRYEQEQSRLISQAK